MARILLNTRASRITIASDILLLPAEVKDDERLGKVIKPSKTLIGERGKPSPYDLIRDDPPTQRLIEAGILEWSDEKAEEPEPVVSTAGAAPLPRADKADQTAKASGSDEADVDYRARIDESGRPLDAFAQADAVALGAPPVPPAPAAGPTGVKGAGAAPPAGETGAAPGATGTHDRVHTDETRDAVPHGGKAKGGHSKGG